MLDKLIHFNDLEWEQPKEGAEQKVHSVGNKRLRLVRLHDTLIEEAWCLNGHIGFVVAGEMSIDFNGTVVKYQQGDGLWITKGERHKVIIEKGKFVELILFELVE